MQPVPARVSRQVEVRRDTAAFMSLAKRSSLLLLCLLLLATALFFLWQSRQSRTAMRESSDYPDNIRVSGQQLRLQGLAVRRSWHRPVYQAALYLPVDTATAGTDATADIPWQLHLVQLADQNSRKRCFEWYIGMERNHAQPSPELKHAFDTLCAPTREIRPGDTLLLTHEPGLGTHVTINGETARTIPGTDFAHALLASWIGERPVPGRHFKEELLGIQ